MTTDRIIKAALPFLSEGSILFIGEPAPELECFGSTRPFIYLPELLRQLSPELLQYLFPGQVQPSTEDICRHIRQIAHLGEESGFLYRENGTVRFRPLGGQRIEDTVAELTVNPFLPEKGEVMFSITGRDIENSGFPLEEEEAEYSPAPEPAPEEPLDARVEDILRDWTAIEAKYGITLEQLQTLLDYQIGLHLSHLRISPSGKIVLSDWEGTPEVKMDDLTKALYLFYLRHPEGVAQKDLLHSHGNEILRIYEGISGRSDTAGIRTSVRNLLDPYGDNLNTSFSRIKRAFKNVVGDRIAKFYYVDGRRGEPRSIRLDRDLVIWKR